MKNSRYKKIAFVPNMNIAVVTTEIDCFGEDEPFEQFIAEIKKHDTQTLECICRHMSYKITSRILRKSEFRGKKEVACIALFQYVDRTPVGISCEFDGVNTIFTKRERSIYPPC
jgi:hypothetical protein